MPLIRSLARLPLGVARRTGRAILRQIRSKEDEELLFQRGWARRFAANRHLVEEYWNQGRHLAEIKQAAGINAHSRVLDVGCGISSVLHFLEGERVGVDPLADEYKQLYDYPPDLKIVASKGERLPFDDAHFDTVFCCNVIDHVESPQGVLDEIDRVLRPGGCMVLTVEIFERAIKRNAAHPHTFTRESARALALPFGEELLAREVPWIGLNRYVLGERESNGNTELILVLRKD